MRSFDVRGFVHAVLNGYRFGLAPSNKEKRKGIVKCIGQYAFFRFEFAVMANVGDDDDEV